MRFLRTHSKAAQIWIKLQVCCGVFTCILFVIQAYCLASIANDVYIHQATLSDVEKLIFILGICVVFRCIVSYYKEFTSFKSADIAKSSLRRYALTIILNQEQKNNISYQTGEISALLVEQVEATHDFFASYLPQLMLVGLIPVIILMVVFPLNWVAGCLLLITAPLIPLFMALVGLGAKAANERNFKALSRLSNYFLDSLRGISTIKNFNLREKKSLELEQSTIQLRKKTMEVLRIAFLSSAVLEFFSAIAIAMLATYLGLSFLGHLNVGYYGHQPTLKVALFILILAPEFYLPLRQFGNFYHAKQQALVVSENLQRLDTDSHAHEINGKCILIENFEKLILQNIAVRYSGNEYNSLDNVNLMIQAGEKIAVVGDSGSGKTTLLNLLLGFVVPTNGVMNLNNNNIKDVFLSSWQKQISWLGQSPQLLAGTLADNLRLANPQACDQELLEACKLVCLENLVLSSNAGLSLKIGENNAGLSGGEAQRLALARMYLKPNSLLIMDEPTAHLDEKNITIIHQAIKKIIANKTTIISTHKKETARLADRVILLHEGKILADGKFEQIILHPLLAHWRNNNA